MHSARSSPSARPQPPDARSHCPWRCDQSMGPQQAHTQSWVHANQGQICFSQAFTSLPTGAHVLTHTMTGCRRDLSWTIPAVHSCAWLRGKLSQNFSMVPMNGSSCNLPRLPYADTHLLSRTYRASARGQGSLRCEQERRARTRISLARVCSKASRRSLPLPVRPCLAVHNKTVCCS